MIACFHRGLLDKLHYPVAHLQSLFHPLRNSILFLQVTIDVVNLPLHITLSNAGQEFVQAVATTCVAKGLMKTTNGYRLDAVPCTVIGMELKEQHGGFTGKLMTNLRCEECQPFFNLIDGPLGTQPAVLANLSALIKRPHTAEIRSILKKMQINDLHPSYITL